MLITYKIKDTLPSVTNTLELVNTLYEDNTAPVTLITKTNKFYNDFSYDRYKTTAVDVEKYSSTYANINDWRQTVRQLDKLTQDISNFLKHNPNPHEMYCTFKIPKRTGGMRTIDAPKEDLMDFMKQLQPWFTYKLNCLPHDSAYAYIQGRDSNKALQRHQAIKPNWFLKLDIKNFFNNCDNDFISKQLRMLYPFALMEDDNYEFFIKNLITLITKDGGLPQGTPLSPVITNLLMVPIDRDINRELNKCFKEKQQSYMYTRYADDMLISSNKEITVKEVTKIINKVLNTYSDKLALNIEKTRYGSKAGSNWNLGIMYNKEHKLTVGYRRKKKIKTMLFQFHLCYNKGERDKEYAQAVLGELAYMHNIEPDYTQNLIKWMNEKYNTDFYNILYKTIKEK